MIGSKIKSARNAKGYSQEYMAALLNVTQSSYARIESNKVCPDIFKLKTIASALGLDMGLLINEVHQASQNGLAGF